MIRGNERTLSFSIGEGSLLRVQGEFLCLGDNGHLLALSATPDGAKVHSRSWLCQANECWTPLALSAGLLYVCQKQSRALRGETPASAVALLRPPRRGTLAAPRGLNFRPRGLCSRGPERALRTGVISAASEACITSPRE